MTTNGWPGPARAAVADFWDEVLTHWAAGSEHPSADLREWRRAYPGQVDDQHYPDPYVGDLRGETSDPRIVLLGLNPGIGYEDLQGRDGIWTRRIADVGYSRCFERSPEEDLTTWRARHGKRSPYWVKAVYFAQRWLRDPSADHRSILNLELFPWHSAGLTERISPPRGLVEKYIWAPLAEVDTTAVFGFGADWLRFAAESGLPLVGAFGKGGDPIPGWPTDKAHWRFRLHRLPSGQLLVANSHSGNSNPPASERLELMRPLIQALS